jgi:hypothetical protein
MSSEIITNRNRLIAGLVILLILVVLVIYFLVASLSRRTERPQLDHRLPVAALTYCGAEQDKLCVISFSQEVDGGMQISFQTPFAYYPEFLVKINHDGEETIYECERREAGSTSVVCTGKPQVPGVVLEFRVFSKNWGTLLAEGNFAIIGIALSTPEVEVSATLEGGTGTPTTTPTFAPRFNTPAATQTALTPSYPNPSYPNPSYP